MGSVVLPSSVARSSHALGPPFEATPRAPLQPWKPRRVAYEFHSGIAGTTTARALGTILLQGDHRYP